MALPICTITGTVYLGSGEVAPDGFKVTLLGCTKNGKVISDKDLTFTVAGGAGVVVITAPRLSTIRVFAEAGEWWRSRPDLTVPDSATANLEDLILASELSLDAPWRYRSLVYTVAAGSFTFITDSLGNPLYTLESLE